MGKQAQSRKAKIQEHKEIKHLRAVEDKARVVDLALESIGLSKAKKSEIATAEIIVGDECYSFLNNSSFFGYSHDDLTSVCDPSIEALWQSVFTNCTPPYTKTFVETTQWIPGLYGGIERTGFATMITHDAEHGRMNLQSFYIAQDHKGVSVDEIGFCDIQLNDRGGVHKVDMHDSLQLDDGCWDMGCTLAVSLTLVTLVFLNCANITTIEVVPTLEDNAIYSRYHGRSMVKYKTLAIRSMRKDTIHNNQPQQHFDVMPLHLRRGHFAHYTDEAPLFGKYTGTFWRPAAVVGNEKNGVVVKDYKVLPPADG